MSYIFETEHLGARKFKIEDWFVFNKIMPFFSNDSSYGLVCYGSKLLCGRKGKAHRAQTIEEAQRRAVFLIFPILALVIGQLTGVIL